MITKIKRFALPCILTALWICALLEVFKFLAPVGYFLGLVENYHYQVIRLNNALIDSTFLCGLIEVFSLLFYIALTLSVPFVFSAIYKRYNGSDDSCEKYLLTTVFVVIFCRLSWTNCVGGLYIVGSLCLGIGVLFVTPYHNQARANFFASIIRNDALNNALPETYETSETIETVETDESTDVLEDSVIA